jgi:hypothetical protein
MAARSSKRRDASARSRPLATRHRLRTPSEAHAPHGRGRPIGPAHGATSTWRGYEMPVRMLLVGFQPTAASRRSTESEQDTRRTANSHSPRGRKRTPPRRLLISSRVTALVAVQNDERERPTEDLRPAKLDVHTRRKEPPQASRAEQPPPEVWLIEERRNLKDDGSR